MKVHSVLFSVLLLTLIGCAASSEAPTAKKSFDVRTFGATGDGTTKDTAAFQKALDAAGAAGGGEILIPAGEYLVGSIVMPSNTTLRFQEGSHLVATQDKDDYPLMEIRWEGRWRQGHRALIHAANAQNIAIVGPGKITGPMKLADLRNPRGPCVFEPIECKNIRLDGFSVQYRRMWTMHLTYCDDVDVRNLTIRSERDNGDGIDVDSCRNVKITGCDIDSGDDAIAIKSGRGMEAVRIARPSENIEVTNCRLGSAFAGFAIGSEMSGGVRNVRVKNCTFTRGSNGVFIKSRIGRGGFIENVEFIDIVSDGPRRFVQFDQVKRGKQDEEPVRGMEGVPLFRNIRFENVKSSSGVFAEATLTTPVKPIENLSFINITGTCRRGVSLANVRGVELKEIKLTGSDRPIVRIENVTGTGLEGAEQLPPSTRPAPQPLPATGPAATR